MTRRSCRLLGALMLTALSTMVQSHVYAADDAKSDPSKPMMKKEPMAGEMKKDGMMKEDVSKAAKQWDKKMQDKMEKEKSPSTR